MKIILPIITIFITALFLMIQVDGRLTELHSLKIQRIQEKQMALQLTLPQIKPEEPPAWLYHTDNSGYFQEPR